MAYYSKLDTTVYHTCRNCTVGNNIESHNLANGQPAGARLCRDCQQLQSDGNCTPGTPTPAR